MKFLVALAMVVALGGSARAQDNDKGTFGLGLVVGEPTGISAKLYLDDTHALQAALGSAFVAGGLDAHVDYLWHPWILDQGDSFDLVGYIGPGASFVYYEAGRGSTGYPALGIRGVVGLVFDFTSIPLDVFAEVAALPEFKFHTGDHWGITLDAGAGARYYF